MICQVFTARKKNVIKARIRKTEGKQAVQNYLLLLIHSYHKLLTVLRVTSMSWNKLQELSEKFITIESHLCVYLLQFLTFKTAIPHNLLENELTKLL